MHPSVSVSRHELSTDKTTCCSRAGIRMAAHRWSENCFVDYLNNAKGGILGSIPSDLGLDTRFCPRTIGNQFEHHPRTAGGR